MQTDLPRLVDGILSKIVFFGLGAIAGGYFLRTPTDIIAFATVFSICCSELYLAFLGKKHVPKAERQRRIATRERFVYADDRFALDYFIKALSKKREVKRERRFAGVNGVALFCRIKPEPLRADELIDMLAYAAKRGYRRAVVLTDAFSPAAAKAAAAFDGAETRLLGFDEVYRLLRSLDALPEPEKRPKKRTRMRDFLSAALSPSRANAYLICSLALFAASGFTLFSVYYLAVAAAMLVLSFVVRFVKKRG